ncbi:MAG: rhodanese-related sulfurtransferase [Thiohalomonadales bacterium]
MSQYVVAALYHFVRLENFSDLRQPLLNVMSRNSVKGTLLLANEGINGTVAGTQKGINNLLSWIKQDPRLASVKVKFSYDNELPFYRTKVKLKKEIVTMGVEGIDPCKVVGTYVQPKDWNQLISDPDVLVVDTRNDYETSIGSFKHAVIPSIETFRDFPEYINGLTPEDKTKKIAMFCTGGIRCEKSTAYLKEQGFENVFHLQGGILKYLEEVPQEQSLWQGECFVFDNRVSVDHKLEKGSYNQCYACRLPITEQDKLSEHYIQGVSCPNCYNKKTDEDRLRFEQREKQVQLAKKRGKFHIGA